MAFESAGPAVRGRTNRIISRPRLTARAIQDFAEVAVPPRFGAGKPEIAQWAKDRALFVEHYRGGVFMAIDVISKTIAGQSIHVSFRRIEKSGEKLEPAPHDYPLVELFSHVNDHHSTFDLLYLMMAHRLVTGDSYTWKLRNGLRMPAELWLLPSTWVWAIPSREKFIGAFRVRGVWGEDVDIPAEDVIQISNPNIDWSGSGRYYGWSTMRSDAFAIDAETAMWKRQTHEFKNFAPPGLHYETDESKTRTQLKQVMEEVLSQHSRHDQTGLPIFSPDGWKVKEFRNSMREMDYVRSLDFAVDWQLATRGVPKALVGLVKEHNRSNVAGADLIFCHDSHTECLTEFGWVKHAELNDRTKVACYDPHSDKIVYRYPFAIHRFAYNGPMHYWHTESVDLAVTPDHRMYTQAYGRNGAVRWTLRPIRQLGRSTPYNVLQAAEASCDAVPEVTVESIAHHLNRHPISQTIPSDVWLEFLGYYISEGHVIQRELSGRHVGISQSRKSPLVQKIQACLGKLPYKVYRYEVANGCFSWRIHDKSFVNHIALICGKGAKNKKVPTYIKSWPAESLKILLNALIDGDGTRVTETCFTYMTISTQLADDVQEIALKCGYRAHIKVRKARRPDQHPVYYVVNICTRRTGCVVPARRKTQPYEGQVWCLTVPTGLFVVRRNGKPHISGNCNKTIKPLQQHTMQHLTQNLGQEFGKDVVIWQDPCRPEDIEQTRKNLDTLGRHGGVTPDEMREILGEGKLGPYAHDGQRVMIQMNLTEAPWGNETEPLPKPPPKPAGGKKDDNGKAISQGDPAVLSDPSGGDPADCGVADSLDGRLAGVDVRLGARGDLQGPPGGTEGNGRDDDGISIRAEEEEEFQETPSAAPKGHFDTLETSASTEKARQVQTVIFQKSSWTVARAKKWLREHGMKAPEPDTTENSHRFRQFPPGQCRGGFATLTENMPKGVSMVVCERRGTRDVGISAGRSVGRMSDKSYVASEGEATDQAGISEAAQSASGQRTRVLSEVESPVRNFCATRTLDRAAFVKLWLRQHGDTEERFADVIERYLRGQKRRVLGRLREIGAERSTPEYASEGTDGPQAAVLTEKALSPDDALKLLPTGKEDAKLAEVANKEIERAMATGAKMELDQFPEARALKARIGPVELPEDVANGIRDTVRETFTQDYWTQNVGVNTRRALGRMIQNVAKEGLGVAELAKRIREDKSGAWDRNRAWRIARSESTGALNGGQSIVQAQLLADGTIDGKRWLSVVDDATRTSHLVTPPNDQVIRAGELFQVGSETARYPGDPNLSAANRINCRCTIISEID